MQNMMRRVLSTLSGLSATALVVLAPAIALAEEGAAHAAESGEHGGIVSVFPMAYWGAVVVVPLITFGICALVANKGTVVLPEH
ncbi:MAG: hypothetical protein ACI9VR_002703 [Cognaticolwellia sp.]|jgi:hypothetical protein